MKLKLVSLIIVTSFLAGCAVNSLQEPPPDKTTLSLPISIKISEQGLSLGNLPVGVYQIKNTPVLVSGHQDDMGALAAFGLLGVLVSNEINSRKGAELVKTAEDFLNIKIKEQIEGVFKDLIAQAPLGETFVMEGAQGNTTLEVTQNLLLNFVSETEIVPFVVFKVGLNDSKKNTIWSLIYSSSTGVAKPLQGENSWSEHNFAPLLKSFKKSIHQVARVMLKDINDPFQRNHANKIIVQSPFPFCNGYVQLLGNQLSENKDNLVFLPLIPKGGINVLPKSEIYFRPATNKDPIVLECKAPPNYSQ